MNEDKNAAVAASSYQAIQGQLSAQPKKTFLFDIDDTLLKNCRFSFPSSLPHGLTKLCGNDHTRNKKGWLMAVPKNYVYMLYVSGMKPIFRWIAKHHSFGFVTAARYTKQEMQKTIGLAYGESVANKAFIYFNLTMAEDWVNQLVEFNDSHSGLKQLTDDRYIRAGYKSRRMKALHIAYLMEKVIKGPVVFTDNHRRHVNAARALNDLKEIQWPVEVVQVLDVGDNFSGDDAARIWLQPARSARNKEDRMAHILKLAEKCGLEVASQLSEDERAELDKEDQKIIRDYEGFLSVYDKELDPLSESNQITGDSGDDADDKASCTMTVSNSASRFCPSTANVVRHRAAVIRSLFNKGL